MFVDEAAFEAKAGDGGNGAVSLRRERFVPHGGPDGGDGGRGGSVVLIADPHLRTLIDFTRRARFQADNGAHGGPNHRRGRNGADLEVRLPTGVVVRQADTHALIGELLRPGQRLLLARGGRGGRGNAPFATSTRQTPRFAEKGEPGESGRFALELKLLADVGVIGLPNVGKSSLIARVSAARPKIADYPFTTLVPNLGVVRLEEETSFVIADLPGLVEGAHQGAGRGQAFLRHVERTRLLIHMLDIAAGRDPLEDFAVVNRELRLYQEELASRPQLVALNKVDLRPPERELAGAEDGLRRMGYESFRVSAATGEGVMRLVGRAAELLAALPVSYPSEPQAVPQAGSQPRAGAAASVHVQVLGEGFYQVSGERVERAVVMTDLENEEAVRYLHRRLEAMGVIRKLRAIGAKEGDRVKLGTIELEFRD